MKYNPFNQSIYKSFYQKLPFIFNSCYEMENIEKQVESKKLGTFTGVFTPSILTILGIILFMRLGYVVGNAGFIRVLIIIGLANCISVLTSISLSAIATNFKVKGGGDYYLISRTLGVEFGGAIGIVLFLAQSVSIAFYCIGFGEAVSLILPKNTHVFKFRVNAFGGFSLCALKRDNFVIIR